LIDGEGMATEPKLQRLIRKADLPQYVGLHRSIIADMVKAGTFPKPVRISDRNWAWIEAEVALWQAQKIAASRPEQPQVQEEPQRVGVRR
jgi:prophage regulatory protein